MKEFWSEKKYISINHMQKETRKGINIAHNELKVLRQWICCYVMACSFLCKSIWFYEIQVL